MAQRNKSRKEISQQFYFSKADLKKLFGVSSRTAKRIFELANSLDEGLTYRIEDTKVSLNSVCKVMGMTHDQIKRHCANSAEM